MKWGTGWLGWTEAETDDTTMPVIAEAYAAKLDMIRWMTGKPVPQGQITPVVPAGSKMTPQLMMAMFGKNKR